MSVQLIALDMDGTTLQNDHISISPRTERAIRAALKKGIAVVPATGRLDSLLPESVMKIDGIRYAITSNGAVTYDLKKHEIIHSNFIDPALAQKILRMLPMNELLVEIFKDGKMFVERRYLESLAEYPIPFLHMNFLENVHHKVDSMQEYFLTHGERIEKINMPYVPQQWCESLWNRLLSEKSVLITSSVPNNMEINDINANKGTALKHLAEFLHIPVENVLAMGDNGNDIEMLKYAGISVAPSNGAEMAKAAAKFVTAPNDEDGIAIAIEKYALNA